MVGCTREHIILLPSHGVMVISVISKTNICDPKRKDVLEKNRLEKKHKSTSKLVGVYITITSSEKTFKISSGNRAHLS